MSSTAAKRQRSQAQPTGQWITKAKRLAIYVRDGFLCLYCGRDLRDAMPSEIHLDHLAPKSTGGTNDASNLIVACVKCNCSRKNRPWTEYATGGALARILDHINRPLNLALARAILDGTAGNPELENAR